MVNKISYPIRKERAHEDSILRKAIVKKKQTNNDNVVQSLGLHHCVFVKNLKLLKSQSFIF